MSANQHDHTTRERILSGVRAPLRWGLFGASGVLFLMGALAQAVALATMSGANRLTGEVRA